LEGDVDGSTIRILDPMIEQWRRIPRSEIFTEEAEPRCERHHFGLVCAQTHAYLLYRGVCAPCGFPRVCLAAGGNGQIIGIPDNRESFIKERRIDLRENEIREYR
jgi:hypothetical protein